MNEQEAKERLNVPRGTLERLEIFVSALAQENERQNLVSRSSLEHVWSRHILDSAQLVQWAPSASACWLDLGTGAGLPGLVVALLHDGPVTMIEARRLRVEFLKNTAERLSLTETVQILCAKVEAVEAQSYDVISARAFAPLGKLLELGERFATPETRWVLPKGRNAKTELEQVRSSWQGEFRLEASLTDADAHIIVAEHVRRRGQGKKAR